MSISSHPSKNRGNRTTVLHLSANVESSDPGRETVDLAILTQRFGWRAVIASAGGRLVNDAERAAVRHKRMPLDRSGPFNNWRNRLLLEATFQGEKPALIHAHGIEPMPFAVALNRQHNVPLVADFTQPVPNNPNTHKLFDALKTARAALRVPSDYMKQHLREVFGAEEDRICLVPPGIDLKCYSVGFISPERLQKISALWRLPEQASIILAPMPLEPDMGHKGFLEVLREMRDENIFAVLVGRERQPNGMRKEVEDLITTYGLTGKVIMPDDCPDLPAACWLSSVVVAPNPNPRGQNLELLAAQAIGRPVIITDIGANRDMVRIGETALVVKADDKKAMADALREAINLDTEQRLAVASCTHDFVAERFPQGAWFDGMMEMYEQLLHPMRQTVKSGAA